jgi:hypothetical protein
VQDVDGGAGVVQGPVVGGGGGAEELGEAGEPVVGGLVAAHELACQMDGVEDGVARPLVTGCAGRAAALRKETSKPALWATSTRPGGELEEGCEGGLDAGCVGAPWNR